MKDTDYIPSGLFTKLENQFKATNMYAEIFMGDLYLCKDGGGNIGIRTIGELKLAYFKLTNDQLIIPE